MSITNELVARIWERKNKLKSLSSVHNEFVRWGGDCSYETFRQFAHGSTLGTGKLIDDLDKYLNEMEAKQ